MKWDKSLTWAHDPGRSFPHMSREDSAVWRQFLLSDPELYRGGEIDYDVQVALKRDEILSAPKPYDAMWQTLRSKRIDAVVVTDIEVSLMEVKPTFTAAGIGQLLVYAWWYREDHTPVLPLRLVAVCYRVDRDIIPLLIVHDIRLVTLAP